MPPRLGARGRARREPARARAVAASSGDSRANGRASGARRDAGAVGRDDPRPAPSPRREGASVPAGAPGAGGPWGRAVAERRGYRIGVVAVARRLAGVLWAIWRDGMVYDGKGAATASSKRQRVATQSSEVAQDARKRVAHEMRARQRSIRKGLGVAANPQGRDEKRVN